MKTKHGYLGFVIIIMTTIFVLAGCPMNDDSNQASYTEGDILVQNVLIHYYFSNSVEGLQKAADDNHITLNPPLKNATWQLNPDLDNNVKQAMASRNVSYCGTLYGGYIVANKKVGNAYYITAYY